MGKLDDSIITEFVSVGRCKINISELSKKSVWAKGFYIAEWSDSYRLVREGKKRILLKINISNTNAYELIAMHDLMPLKNAIFSSGTDWRTPNAAANKQER